MKSKRVDDVDLAKLKELGFEEKTGAYVCEKPLIDGDMMLQMSVSREGELTSRVIDNDTGEEYTLHLSESAVGTFVGRVRFEYEQELSRVKAVLLQGYRFEKGQTNEIIDYVSLKYGDELEFLWKETPDNAICRRKETGKWYLALLKVSASKIGLDGEEKIEIVNLHAEPEMIEKIVDGVRFFPGYHMNKRHWLTIPLDERVPTTQILTLIDESYRLAKKK